MSELINNTENRKELLKHMILQLHKGEAPDMVRNRLAALLAKIPYDEVVEVEQELINEGLPAEEVLKFCDIHTMVLEGKIDQSGARSIPAGHPVDTFKMENRELLVETAKAETEMDTLLSAGSESIPSLVLKIKASFNAIMDVDKHYKRKEYLLFPFLEKYGITGPPTVMWGKHDETRVLLKKAQEDLTSASTAQPDEVKAFVDASWRPAVKAIGDMIMKEEEILLPMSMDRLSDQDWYHIYNQTHEFGYCLYDPADTWKPEGLLEEEEMPAETGFVQLPSGRFKLDELTAILSILPIDLTFVDKDDKVRFFSMGTHRIFPRNRAILGRDVRMCHPPSSVDVVEQILTDFKSGKESSAPFWINFQGRFIHIEYFAVRDDKGSYLGTLEFSQDLTALRALEGEQRLLSYDAGVNASAKKSYPGMPEWYAPERVVIHLDARPLLARGEHPVAAVLQQLDAMKTGDIFEIITPFLPEPMLEKVRAAGCEVFSKQEDGLFHSYFYKP